MGCYTKVRGHGYVAIAANEVSIDTIPVNDNPLANNKEIEEEVKVEDVE